METITLTIERPDLSTGNLYSVQKRFGSVMLRRCVKSVGEQMEDAIVDMRKQLDAREKEVRTHKPNLT